MDTLITKNHFLTKIQKLIVTSVFLLFIVFVANAQEIIAEAEEGVLLGSNTNVETTIGGFSGTGYVEGFKETSDGVRVTVTVDNAGEYSLSVGFSAPYGPKDNIIFINGVAVDTVHFPEIPSFSEKLVGDFDFVEGENTISFKSFWGWCLFDYFKITDIAPRGDFTYTPDAVATGDVITFDASATSDPNGTIDLYEWNFGDGTTATGNLVEHTFTKAKKTTVSLKMTDNDGNSSSIVKQIDVSRAEPYAVFAYSTAYPEPSVSISFDGSLSYDLSDEVVSYAWDFGDGTSTSGSNVAHTFAGEGNYPVSLTVTNSKGKSDTRTTILYVYTSATELRGPSLLTATPKTNEKIEFGFEVKADYENPYDPDQILVDAVVTYPGAADSIIVPCFYFQEVNFISNNWVADTTLKGWRCRISVPQAGEYTIKLKYTNEELMYSNSLPFTVAAGDVKGIIHNDETNGQYYRHTGGEPFYPMGINIGWNSMEGFGNILTNISAFKANLFRYWHTPFSHQALEWSDNGFYDGLGYYSQEASKMTDSLINLGSELGIYMQLTMFQHGPFSENVDPIWDENPYNTDNGGFVEKAEAYFYNSTCKHYTKKLLRYIVARWGYSPTIYAWEFFNEMNFSGLHPEQSGQWYAGLQQWHSEMADYVESIDAYDHIMTTSVSDKDDLLYNLDTIESLDLLQYHLYKEDILTEQKAHDYTFKEDLDLPVLNGEYGGALNSTDMSLKWQQISLWNGIMTEVPHLMWEWGAYSQELWGKVFEKPMMFLQNEDLALNTNLAAVPLRAVGDNIELQTTALADDSTFYGVVYDFNGGILSNAYLDSLQMAYGNYDIEFYSGTSDLMLALNDVPLVQEYNRIELPVAINEIAFKIKFSSAYTLPIAIAGPDQFIPLGNTIAFDGSNSIAPGEGTLNYVWNLISKPQGSALDYTNTAATSINVTPDISGYYYFTLTVDNGSEYSLPDTLLLVSSTKPVADAGPDALVQTRITTPLDGTGSYDADGETLSYYWDIVEKPEGSRPRVIDYDILQAQFYAKVIGDYVITLVVDDGIQKSDADTVVITVVNDVAVQSAKVNALSVYPNPAKSQVVIKMDAVGNQTALVSLHTIVGKKIIDQAFEVISNGATAQINLELNEYNLNAGLYILSVQLGQENYTERLLIE